MDIQFSIIIPFSRPAKWPLLAKQIDAISYPSKKWEAIVVLNGVDNWQPTSLPQNTRCIYETKLGPSFARNAGIHTAKFSYQLFLDDDCIFESTILKKYAKAWQKHPKATMLGGRVLATLKNGDQKLTKVQQKYLHDFDWCFGHLDYGSQELLISMAQPLFSANLSVRQPVKQKYFFSELLGKIMFGQLFLAEDCLLSYQLLCQEKKVVYVPEIFVQNVVEKKRFTQSYLRYRTLLAGAERFVMDAILRSEKLWHSHLEEIVTLIRYYFLNFLSKREKPMLPLKWPWFLTGYFLLGIPLYFTRSFATQRK